MKPSPYNEVTLDDLGRVVKFREKPNEPANNMTAIALYYLTPRPLELVPQYLRDGGNPDAPGHRVAWLVEQLPVHSHPLPGQWFDVGNLETLEFARARFGA